MTPDRPTGPPEITLHDAIYATVWAVGLASILALLSMVRGAVDASCGAHGCDWRPAVVERGDFAP